MDLKNFTNKSEVLDEISSKLLGTKKGTVDYIIKNKSVLSKIKYSLLAGILFILFSIIPCSKILCYITPGSNKILIYLYLFIIFVIVYSIIIRTSFFENL